jgi:hypothetical protein
MSYASDLQAYTEQYQAWTMPLRYKAALVRTTRNQHGVCYRFTDGSALFVPKGVSQGYTRPR